MTISADQLSPRRPIVVIGAAFGDIILHLDALPQSGSDVPARDGGRQIGGCAFNVARALSRLELFPVNAIPVGNGDWGQAVAQKMALENLPVLLRHPTHDNGWCLALVEADKERTFITIEGCEQHWTDELLAQIPLPNDAIIYVSGYELASEALRQWLLAQAEDKTLFVDFGPRLGDLDIRFIQALLRKRPVLTLNRDELRCYARVYTIGMAPRLTTPLGSPATGSYEQFVGLIRMARGWLNLTRNRSIFRPTVYRFTTRLPQETATVPVLSPGWPAGWICSRQRGWAIKWRPLLSANLVQTALRIAKSYASSSVERATAASRYLRAFASIARMLATFACPLCMRSSGEITLRSCSQIRSSCGSSSRKRLGSGRTSSPY